MHGRDNGYLAVLVARTNEGFVVRYICLKMPSVVLPKTGRVSWHTRGSARTTWKRKNKEAERRLWSHGV